MQHRRRRAVGGGERGRGARCIAFSLSRRAPENETLPRKDAGRWEREEEKHINPSSLKHNLHFFLLRLKYFAEWPRVFAFSARRRARFPGAPFAGIRNYECSGKAATQSTWRSETN